MDNGKRGFNYYLVLRAVTLKHLYQPVLRRLLRRRRLR